MTDADYATESDLPVYRIDDRCRACGKTRFAHVPDPPDGYWPDCTTFVEPAVINAAHLCRQRAWSHRTFGPGARLLGVLDHIRKELAEIEADPGDVEEWVDVIILAFDGAWRAGWEPQQIIDAIKAKQAKNEAREWPDWRTMREDQAIEHVEPEPSTESGETVAEAEKRSKRTLLIDADVMAAALTDPALAGEVLAAIDAAEPRHLLRAATQSIARLVNEAARKATVR